jgi:hypothetical protein
VSGISHQNRHVLQMHHPVSTKSLFHAEQEDLRVTYVSSFRLPPNLTPYRLGVLGDLLQLLVIEDNPTSTEKKNHKTKLLPRRLGILLFQHTRTWSRRSERNDTGDRLEAAILARKYFIKLHGHRLQLRIPPPSPTPPFFRGNNPLIIPSYLLQFYQH